MATFPRDVAPAVTDNSAWGQGPQTVLLPQVGCGLGERDWEKEVKPILESVFGDDQRITIIVLPRNGD